MHPNVFLRTFWQMELRPEIFVAMTFGEDYQARYDDVIAPAIRSVDVGGVSLEPRRVDESKSGDSILTEIMDGIAHSQMVLADVSTIGKDSKSGRAYRNGNVMYEVGIALACRQPQEILLVRDDQDAFLFDVSTIPHTTLDFTETAAAKARLTEELASRLNERKLMRDARVLNAISGLSREEVVELRELADYSPTTVWGQEDKGMVNLFQMAATTRLLDKQLIRFAGLLEEGHIAYQTTELGRVVAGLVASGLRKYTADAPPETPTTDEPAEAGPEDGQPPDSTEPEPNDANGPPNTS